MKSKIKTGLSDMFREYSELKKAYRTNDNWGNLTRLYFAPITIPLKKLSSAVKNHYSCK
jgi:hypothetical protein